LVALTVNASLVIVYGNVASIVMFIYVFNVGFADIGVMEIPAFVFAIIVSESVYVTIWALIVIVIVTVAPALNVVSKGEVKQTSVVDVDS